MFLVIIYLPWGALHRTSNGAGDDRRHQPSRAHRALGIATMWEAVFADVGVTLLAVLNAVRASNRRF